MCTRCFSARSSAISRALAACSLLLPAACTAPQGSEPAITSAPASRGAPPAVQPHPDRPEPDQPTAGSSTSPSTAATSRPTQPDRSESRPATRPADRPEFVTIVERFEGDQPARVTGGVSAGRVVLDTDNVRVLRIDRRKLPFARNRSVPLLLDGQGIEMTGKSDLVELIRSRNGQWTPRRE